MKLFEDLVSAATDIKRVFGQRDQDIEWAYMKGQIYIVQSRPFVPGGLDRIKQDLQDSDRDWFDNRQALSGISPTQCLASTVTAIMHTGITTTQVAGWRSCSRR